MFAEVMRSGADEVADVFDEQNIEGLVGKFFKSAVYECDVEVAGTPVVICWTGTSGRSRSASRSVARSPTRTAMLYLPFQYLAAA